MEQYIRWALFVKYIYRVGINVFAADTCNPMWVSFVHLLVKDSALQLPCYLEFAAKQYCADHRTANAIQLIAAIKGNFSGLFFYWAIHTKGEFPRD